MKKYNLKNKTDIKMHNVLFATTTEKDYEMRGEGDLFGVKQSGDMSFKVANLRTDMKILLQAKDDSKEFLLENKDNGFENYKEYAKIINEMTNLD